MTGPPNETPHSDRNSPTVRAAQPAAPELFPSPPPGTSPSAYQLSLAQVLPWLEGDRSPKGRSFPPPVPAAPQPSHHHHLSASRWSWDAGGAGGGGGGAGSPSHYAAATGARGTGGPHAASRKNSNSSCSNAGSNRHSDAGITTKSRAAGQADAMAMKNAVCVPHAHVFSGPHAQQQPAESHHSNSFPQHSSAAAAANRLQNPSATSVTISISGADPSTNTNGAGGGGGGGLVNTTAVAGSISSKTYSVQLPLLIPARALRPRGSFSSSSGLASGSGGAASSSVPASGSAGYPGRPGSASIAPHSGAPVQGGPPTHGASLSHEGSSSSSHRGVASGTRQLKFALVVRGRGLSRTPLDDHHPIDSIKDSDLFERTCGHNLQKALKSSQQETPCSSGRSSPTIKETQSPMSVSQGGWTTGNTTERSSLDSSYSLADFDKQAANTVSQHFEEFEAALYEGQSPSYLTPRPGSSTHAMAPSLHAGLGGASFLDGPAGGSSSSPQSDLARECREWSAQFPHLRVLGKQACPIRDPGFYHVPSSDASSGSRPASSSLLLEVSDHDMSMSSDSQALSLTGHAVSPVRAPKEALVASEREGSSSAYSFLVEEVIAEDGLYEDIIAVDYKNIYEDNLEHKQQITPRRRRVGFPPITPNACVKDSVTSGAFDHIWQEIMSWMRQLLKRYASEITDSKHDDVTSYSPHLPTQSTPISRDLSFIRQHGGSFTLQRSHTHVGSSTDRSIDGILHISSMPLQNRNQLLDASDSPGLGGPGRPGSSLQPGAQPRPMSHLRASGGHARAAARGGRLAPLAKNLNTEDTGRHSAIDALRVRGRTPMSGDLLPASPASFHRNGALPPLEMERRKPFQSYRATSAIDNKDTRLLSFKDRPHLLAEQARPNTTHAMRSETPFGNTLNRRSSTPLGNTISARNALLANKSLDVRGNSLQPGDTSHFHPDIQEDQQESPGEEIYRTHWNAAQSSHSIYHRRNRVTLK